jgi:NAD(P)-dependent dehydrogenase (short-subunit alcohol dehydrogenase family)
MTSSERPAPVGAAVVTGAARGIGQAIAARFAADGRAVVGVDLDGDGLTATISALPPGDHVAVVGDAVDEDVMEAAFAAAGARGGSGVFVANAGVAQPGRSVDYPLDAWDRLMDVHVKGAFVGARVARRHMTRGGAIVMISSVNGHIGMGGRAAYCAAKAGIQGLVRSLAVEWAPQHIRVNAVSPGSIATPMQREFMRTGFASPEAFLSRIPLGRFGAPEEIADAVAFLGSERSTYITGVVLPVDGGWLAFGLPGDEATAG